MASFPLFGLNYNHLENVIKKVALFSLFSYRKYYSSKIKVIFACSRRVAMLESSFEVAEMFFSIHTGYSLRYNFKGLLWSITLGDDNDINVPKEVDIEGLYGISFNTIYVPRQYLSLLVIHSDHLGEASDYESFCEALKKYRITCHKVVFREQR